VEHPLGPDLFDDSNQRAIEQINRVVSRPVRCPFEPPQVLVWPQQKVNFMSILEEPTHHVRPHESRPTRHQATHKKSGNLSDLPEPQGSIELKKLNRELLLEPILITERTKVWPCKQPDQFTLLGGKLF
jgi:hypothetical protein